MTTPNAAPASAEKRQYPLPECEHCGLDKSCRACAAEARIQELERQLAEAQSELDEIRCPLTQESHQYEKLQKHYCCNLWRAKQAESELSRLSQVNEKLVEALEEAFEFGRRICNGESYERIPQFNPQGWHAAIAEATKEKEGAK